MSSIQPSLTKVEFTELQGIVDSNNPIRGRTVELAEKLFSTLKQLEGEGVTLDGYSSEDQGDLAVLASKISSTALKGTERNQFWRFCSAVRNCLSDIKNYIATGKNEIGTSSASKLLTRLDPERIELLLLDLEIRVNLFRSVDILSYDASDKALKDKGYRGIKEQFREVKDALVGMKSTLGDKWDSIDTTLVYVMSKIDNLTAHNSIPDTYKNIKGIDPAFELTYTAPDSNPKCPVGLAFQVSSLIGKNVADSSSYTDLQKKQHLRQMSDDIYKEIARRSLLSSDSMPTGEAVCFTAALDFLAVASGIMPLNR